MKKIMYDDVVKMYTDKMLESQKEFFENQHDLHGWTHKEFVDALLSEQRMIDEYNQVVKPLVDSGMMYLN